MGSDAVKYFRAQDVSVYEAVRALLDSAYGYPNADTKTTTAIPKASESILDRAGRVYLLASDAECQFPAVAELLPQLLSSALVEEIDASTYLQELPQIPVQ
jgi:hypothetical protein